MLGGLPKYRLRCILSGALATRSRLHRNDREVLPTCQLCGGTEEETTVHLFDSCPALEDPRRVEMSRELWEELPPRVRLHGLAPNDLQLPDSFDAGQMGRKQLACMVQHNLLDMWETRCRLDPEGVRLPVPRWHRDVRRRLNPNIPVAVPPDIPVHAPGARGVPRAADAQHPSRSVRARPNPARVQYSLLDMLANRDAFLPERVPKPRWATLRRNLRGNEN